MYPVGSYCSGMQSVDWTRYFRVGSSDEVLWKGWWNLGFRRNGVFLYAIIRSCKGDCAMELLLILYTFIQQREAVPYQITPI